MRTGSCAPACITPLSSGTATPATRLTFTPAACCKPPPTPPPGSPPGPPAPRRSARLPAPPCPRAGRAARRRLRPRGGGLTAVLTALVLALAAATAVAVRVERQVAQQLDVVTSGLLASQSQLIGDANPALSKLLSVAAWRLTPSSAARHAMLAAAARPGIAVFNVTGSVYSVAFSPDGKTLAAGSNDGT